MPSLHIVSAFIAVRSLCAILACADPSRWILTFDSMRSILRFTVITPNTPIRIACNRHLIDLRVHLHRIPSKRLNMQRCRDVMAFQQAERS